MAFEKKDIPKKSDDLSSWYNKVVLEAELADYGPAKGTMIFRPYGYAIWENIQQEINDSIKKHGVDNAYFPMFIPESLLKKEQKHVEGFAPELAVVTIGGGKELDEKLVVRPTSETIMYDSYARWIQSWRDLPIMINQWNNVVRWEKRTYLFLRTTEFLWQEGHTAHATHEDALGMVDWAISMYETFYKEFMAIPGYVGKKSEAEKFAGADMSMSYETLMPEGKALQSSTAHDLGQNFAKGFEISYIDKDEKKQHVWQTSWGISTRSIGALLMTHGDDQGLRLPPKIAPIQVIIVPVGKTKSDDSFVKQTFDNLIAGGIRVKIDTADDESMGRKINKWELKGVPLRIVIGPNESENKTLTFSRRDTFEKIADIEISELLRKTESILSDIQSNLLEQATQFLKNETREASDYSDFKKIMMEQRGFISAPWCEDATCEKEIKDETKATVRCLPDDSPEISAKCIKCGQAAKHNWLFAQAY